MRRGGRILGAVLLVSMVGCQSAADEQVGTWFDRNGSPVPNGSSAADEQVGTWFDRNGSPVPNGYMDARLVLSVGFGPEHCGWQDTVFMHMAWPLNRAAGDHLDQDHVRAYVWQANDAFDSESLTSEPRIVPQMPADARPAGLHRGEWELWISRSHLDEAVFVTDGDTTQSWAYSKHLPACA